MSRKERGSPNDTGKALLFKITEKVDVNNDDSVNNSVVKNSDVDVNNSVNNSVNNYEDVNNYKSVNNSVNNVVSVSDVTSVNNSSSDVVNVSDSVSVNKSVHASDATSVNNIKTQPLFTIARPQLEEETTRMTYHLKVTTTRKIKKLARHADMGVSEFLQQVLDNVLDRIDIE